MCLKIPIGSKCITQITNSFDKCVLQFSKKKNWSFKFQKCPFFNHFWSIFGSYIIIFYKTEIQTVFLRCLVCKNLNLIKSYNIVSKRFFFFSWVKMHYFRASLPKWILIPQKETSSCVFKMDIFSKFFWAFMRHIIM